MCILFLKSSTIYILFLISCISLTMENFLNHRTPGGAYTQQVQQLELLYICLYLLIWGEASNVRFMPECLCYIFHHVSGNIILLTIQASHWHFSLSFLFCFSLFKCINFLMASNIWQAVLVCQALSALYNSALLAIAIFHMVCADIIVLTILADILTLLHMDNI